MLALSALSSSTLLSIATSDSEAGPSSDSTLSSEVRLATEVKLICLSFVLRFEALSSLAEPFFGSIVSSVAEVSDVFSGSSVFEAVCFVSVFLLLPAELLPPPLPPPPPPPKLKIIGELSFSNTSMEFATVELTAVELFSVTLAAMDLILLSLSDRLTQSLSSL